MVSILHGLGVYIATALALYVLGRLVSRREKYYNKQGRLLSFWTWEIVASLLLFSFVSGIRWNVGVDYLSYLSYYRIVQLHGVPIIEFEPGFNWLTKWMAQAGFHYSFYFGLLAFFQLFFVYWTFKNEKYLLPFIGLTVILGVSYLSWMNGIRQMLSATIFLYSLQFILMRKLFHYCAIIVFASLIHKSALILLPLAFIPCKDYFNNRLVVFLLLIIVVYFGFDPMWVSSTKNFVTYFLSVIDYQSYSEDFDSLSGSTELKNLGPRRFADIFLFCLLVYYSQDIKRRFSGAVFLMCYNFYVFGFLAYNLLINANHLFLRPLYYLTICGVPTLSYFLVFLYERQKKYVWVYLLVVALSCAYTPISVVADNGLGDKDFSSYRTFFFHER